MTTKLSTDNFDAALTSTIDSIFSAANNALSSANSANTFVTTTTGEIQTALDNVGAAVYATINDLPLSNNANGSLAIVSSTNTLYFWNGAGWYKIALINQTPTITTGGDASYTLAAGTNTVIQLAATDPEEVPITWSYTVTSGAVEDTSVVVSGNTFTIVPGTVAATFDLTFTASDGINTDTSTSSFTLSFEIDWANATLLHTLDNPNSYGTSAGDRFGFSVAMDGNYAIFGSLLEDDAGGTESGKAHIYNATTGALVYTLDNPNAYDTSLNDNFGRSVGISGNYVIVGARDEDDAGGTSSGKAYIFKTTTGDWTDTTLVHTLDNPNAYDTSVSDNFGNSVAISGNYAIVGAYLEDDAGGTQSGKAYIFNVTTGALLHTLDNPNAYGTSAADYFAWSVTISGNYAIVGAYQEDDASGIGSGGSGKAYIYNVTTGALVYTLDNPNAYDTSDIDGFGYNVSINDNYCIIGAWKESDAGGLYSGKAYIFKTTTGDWTDTTLVHTLDNPNAYDTSASDYFGAVVSISDNYAAVSAYYEDDAGGTQSGKAYIFDVTTGNLLKTFDNPTAYDTSVNDRFGQALTIRGNYFIVGAQLEDDAGGLDAGKVYIFQAS